MTHQERNQIPVNTTPRPAPRVVAEAGQCKGSVDYVIEAMRQAKAAGCWATKIQLLQPETIAVADAAIYWYEKRPEIQDQRTNFGTTGCLDYSVVPDLMAAAAEIGIELFASPFDFPAIDAMAKGGMRYIKIASGDLTNEPFVRAAAQAFPTGIIMAVGASTADEIARTLTWIAAEGARPHALLACSLCYPTPLDRAELGRIHTLRQWLGNQWGCEIGYSDHTPGWVSGGLAVAAGATMLEKHYTLDAKDPSVPDNNFALDPTEIAEYVKAANQAHAALGTGSLDPTDIEAPARVGARRTICAARDLPAGHTITAEDLTFLRPADPAGFEPHETDAVIGRTVTADIPANSVVARSGLS
jgi:sialic acid synthase SpsE